MFTFNCQTYFKDFNEKLVYCSYTDIYSICLTQTLLLHFLHSWGSKFTSAFYFSCVWRTLLTILFEQICWQEIILILFHFCIWYKFWHRILGKQFFFSSTLKKCSYFLLAPWFLMRNIQSFKSLFRCRWFLWLLSSIFSLSLVSSSLITFCLFCLSFGQICGVVSQYIFKYFFLTTVFLSSIRL